MASAPQTVHPTPRGDSPHDARPEVTRLSIATQPETQNACAIDGADPLYESPDTLLASVLQTAAVPSAPNSAPSQLHDQIDTGSPAGANRAPPPICTLISAQEASLAKASGIAFGSSIESNSSATPLLFSPSPIDPPLDPPLASPRGQSALLFTEPDERQKPDTPAPPPQATPEERRPGRPYLGKREKSCITFSDCQRLFHLPVDKAAKELGVSRPTIARVMRANGVKRWPYRALRARRHTALCAVGGRTPVQCPRRTACTVATPGSEAPLLNASESDGPHVSEPSHTSMHPGNTGTERSSRYTSVHSHGELPKKGTSATSSNEVADSTFEQNSCARAAVREPDLCVDPSRTPGGSGDQAFGNTEAMFSSRSYEAGQAQNYEIVHLTEQSFPPVQKTTPPRLSKQPDRTPAHVSLSDCQPLFHLPMHSVVENLGVSSPVIAKVMRTHGIKQWPFRMHTGPVGNLETPRIAPMCASIQENCTSSQALSESMFNCLPFRKRASFRESSGRSSRSSMHEIGQRSQAARTSACDPTKVPRGAAVD